jgi:ABC-type transport system involved in cytochrome bd biosynthesis fused ATPase/permease subunit
MIEKTEGGARLRDEMARVLAKHGVAYVIDDLMAALDAWCEADLAKALQDAAPAPLPALESLRDEWIAMGEAEISSQMNREQVAYHNGEAEAYRCCGRDLDAILTSPAYTEEKKK